MKRYSIIVVSLICLFLFPLTHKLIPLPLFYAMIISYVFFILIIISFLRYVLKYNLKEHFFSEKNDEFKTLPLKFPFILGIGTGIIYNIFTLFIALLLKEHFYNVFGNKSINSFQSLFILLIGAPLFEEIFFRGFLQDNIKLVIFPKQNFYYSIILTSLVFAAVHFYNIATVGLYQTLFVSGFALIVGLIAGYYRYRNNNIINCIKIHAGANLGGILAIPIALAVGFVGKSEMQSLSKRSITYNFDLSNDDEFHRNLTDFFIDNFKTKDLKLHDVHCWFPCTFTCNKNGDIVNIQIDTVGEKNLDSQFLNQDLRNSVLKT